MWADAQRQNVMAAQPNVGGALCESSVIPFLLPRHKVWLTAAARVPCSNNIGERIRLGRKVNFAVGKISLGGKYHQNVYIVYQPRRRPNILRSSVGLC